MNCNLCVAIQLSACSRWFWFEVSLRRWNLQNPAVRARRKAFRSVPFPCLTKAVFFGALVIWEEAVFDINPGPSRRLHRAKKPGQCVSWSQKPQGEKPSNAVPVRLDVDQDIDLRAQLFNSVITQKLAPQNFFLPCFFFGPSPGPNQLSCSIYSFQARSSLTGPSAPAPFLHI